MGWDAIKHAGRHLTHGGLKLTSFKQGVASEQSELNFVTTNDFKTRGTQAIVDHALRAKGLTLTNGNAVLFFHVATGLARGIMW